MSRVLVCNSCGDDVEVFEEPVEFMDPDLYVCIRCLDARHAETPAQLLLVHESAGPARRQERRTYDPAQSRIPY